MKPPTKEQAKREDLFAPEHILALVINDSELSCHSVIYVMKPPPFSEMSHGN